MTSKASLARTRKRLLERASRFLPSPEAKKYIEEEAERAGLEPEDWLVAIANDPAAVTRARTRDERVFTELLPVVWNRMLKAAMEGTTADRKLYLQRFDKEFVERKETKKTEQPYEVEFKDFVHAMRLRFGEENWNRAASLAEAAGQRGGVYGENYLPGGKYEGEESVSIDAEVLDSAEEEQGFDFFGED